MASLRARASNPPTRSFICDRAHVLDWRAVARRRGHQRRRNARLRLARAMACGACRSSEGSSPRGQRSGAVPRNGRLLRPPSGGAIRQLPALRSERRAFPRPRDHGGRRRSRRTPRGLARVFVATEEVDVHAFAEAAERSEEPPRPSGSRSAEVLAGPPHSIKGDLRATPAGSRTHRQAIGHSAHRAPSDGTSPHTTAATSRRTRARRSRRSGRRGARGGWVDFQ